MREVVAFGKEWVKAVKWNDGDGFNPKAIQMTASRDAAMTFLPEAAEAIRAKFSPEAIRKHHALKRYVERQAVLIIAGAFVEVTKDWDPETARGAAEILKGL